MSILDPPPLPPSTPASPAYTRDDAERWEGPALDLLRPELRRLRLWDAFKAARMTAIQARRALERLILSGRAYLRSVTGLLRPDPARPVPVPKLSLGAWFAKMRDDVLYRHTAATLGLFGGKPLGPADRDELAIQVTRQVGFLARFRAQIAAGIQLLDGTSLSRAGSYADAAFSTSWGVALMKAIRDGHTEGKRRLHVADHCAGCVREAARGWVRLDQVAPIGSQECRMNCRCEIIWR